MDKKTLHEGDVAVMFNNILSIDQMKNIRDSLSAQFPDRRFLVLDGGATVASISPDQLDRIEAKLDALLEALAQEEDEPLQAFDLDGNPVPSERNMSLEL